MLTRRSWLLVSCGLVLSSPAKAGAKAAGLQVFVPNNSVGAIAAATCGQGFAILVDGSLRATQIKVNGRVLDVGARLHPPGAQATATFLDDPRSAPKLGVNIRNALAQVYPRYRDQLAANHKAWSRTFVRKVITWSHKLEKSKLRGKRFNNTLNRAAALTFAGAIIDPRAKSGGPASLRRLPAQPAEPTLSSYTTYIERIVIALA